MSDTAGEKTEKATPKRLKEARQKGQLQTSRDLTSWLGVGAVAVTLPFTVTHAAGELQHLVQGYVGLIEQPDADVAAAYFGEGLQIIVPTLGVLFGAAVVGTIVGALLQGGIHVKQFKAHGEQFNVVQGIMRMFGKQALWEGAKSLLKTAVVGLAVWWVLQGLVPVLMNAGGLSVAALIDAATGGAGALLQAAVVSGLLLAAIDVLVVARRNRKHTRMSKQEIKDEYKNSDGDPLIKQQRRARAMAMSRNRMMAAIADADVVMLNPTHIAVALKYERGKSAPRVVAKGQGAIAAKIREKAAEHRVPMVQDVPLARALHAACEVGQEIPVELYTAVARVLAFVMSLRARGAAQGVHRFAGAGL